MTSFFHSAECSEIPSRWLHVSILHFLIDKQYFFTWIYCILFTYSSVDRHLSYFHFFSIINNAVMNSHVLVFVWTYVFIFLEHISRSGIAVCFFYFFSIYFY